MTKIAMFGVGRMGREIICMAKKEGFELVAAVDAPDSPYIGKDAGLLCGLEPLGVIVSSAAKLEQVLEVARPDVAIDFTNAEACFWNFKLVCKKKINMVIGTTGLSEKQLAEMRKEAEKNGIGVVISPNMSVGVNVFWQLVREAASKLPGYDIEIIEKHHRFKKDAPSGTALRTAEVIADELGKKLSDAAVYGRKGLMERQAGEIGIHAVRAGDIVGEHTVIYGTLGERVEITHVAHSRSAFVSGVLKAAEFIRNKKGVYGMKEVLGI